MCITLILFRFASLKFAVCIKMKFTFEARAVGNKPYKSFSGNLTCGQCTAESENGVRCTRRVCIGRKMCWQHSRSNLHLKVDKSKIPGAGKGLFAFRSKKKGLTAQQLAKPIFNKGQNIVKYEGENVTRQNLDNRYGDYTAPYALQIGNQIVDAALDRGIASIVNSKPPSRANAKFTESGNVKAMKPIYDGSEIYVYYGRDYKFDKNVTTTTK